MFVAILKAIVVIGLCGLFMGVVAHETTLTVAVLSMGILCVAFCVLIAFTYGLPNTLAYLSWMLYTYSEKLRAQERQAHVNVKEKWNAAMTHEVTLQPIEHQYDSSSQTWRPRTSRFT